MAKFSGTDKEKRAYACKGWIKPNERIRIVLQYGPELKPIMWFRIGSDGSFYFGPRIKNVLETKVHKGRLGPGPTRINFADGQVVPKSDKQNDPSISYHSSGVVRGHLSPGLNQVVPLADITDHRLVGYLVFQHPSVFETVSEEQKGDIISEFPGSEEQPLWCQIFQLPQNNHKVINVLSSTEQQNLTFNVGGEGIDWSYEVQLVLCCGPKGPWPEYTTAVIPTSENEIS